MTVGSVVPVIGTLIGAGIGLAAGAITGAVVNGIAKNSETDEEAEAIRKLGELYEEQGEAALTDESIRALVGSNESLATELINNKDAVRDLCKEMAANTAATRAENKAMVGSILANNSVVQ
jgi:phage shock protein A